MHMGLHRRRWTVPISIGLAAYVTAFTVLMVLLAGDVSTARSWFFAVASLGAVVLGAAIVMVRRHRPRRHRTYPGIPAHRGH